VRPGLTLIILVLNVVAIVSILGTRAAAGRKAAWLLLAVVVPAGGALAWLGTRGRLRLRDRKRRTVSA
jgi:hypothetical protein